MLQALKKQSLPPHIPSDLCSADCGLFAARLKSRLREAPNGEWCMAAARWALDNPDDAPGGREGGDSESESGSSSRSESSKGEPEDPPTPRVIPRACVGMEPVTPVEPTVVFFAMFCFWLSGGRSMIRGLTKDLKAPVARAIAGKGSVTLR